MFVFLLCFFVVTQTIFMSFFVFEVSRRSEGRDGIVFILMLSIFKEGFSLNTLSANVTNFDWDLS